jgi:hypothetical protein
MRMISGEVVLIRIPVTDKIGRCPILRDEGLSGQITVKI